MYKSYIIEDVIINYFGIPKGGEVNKIADHLNVLQTSAKGVNYISLATYNLITGWRRVTFFKEKALAIANLLPELHNKEMINFNQGREELKNEGLPLGYFNCMKKMKPPIRITARVYKKMNENTNKFYYEFLGEDFEIIEDVQPQPQSNEIDAIQW